MSERLQSFPVCVCRGSVGPLPVPAHLPGVDVGRSSHGLQGPVDARPLRHLQLFAGKSDDMFIEFLPPRAFCAPTGLSAVLRFICPHSPSSNHWSLLLVSALA